MSVLQKLTEGVVTRDVRKEGEALLQVSRLVFLRT